TIMNSTGGDRWSVTCRYRKARSPELGGRRIWLYVHVEESMIAWRFRGRITPHWQSVLDRLTTDSTGSNALSQYQYPSIPHGIWTKLSLPCYFSMYMPS